MGTIYRVTIQGRTFESRDLRRLLARAVNEKQSIQHRIRTHGGLTARLAGEVVLARGWSSQTCEVSGR